MTRQVSDQLYIELDYYVPEEYYVYTAEAQSNQVSTSNLSCDAGKITSAAASLTVTTTVAATISHIEGADLFAFSQSQLQIAVDRIRDNNVAVSGVFDVATQVSRLRSFEAAEISDFDFSVVSLRSRDVNLETQAAFSFTAEGEKFSLQETGANLVTESAISILVDKTVNAIIALEQQSTVSAVVSKISDVNSTSNSQSTVSALASKTADGSASLESTTAVSATISHIEGADLQAFGQSELSATADKIVSALINLASETVQSTVNLRIRSTDSNVASTVELSSSIDVNRQATVALAVESQQSTQVSRLRSAESTVSSDSTQSVINDRLRGSSLDIATVADFTCTISHIEGADLAAFGAAALTATANVDYVGDVSFATQFNQQTQAAKSVVSTLSMLLRTNVIVGKFVGTTRPNNVVNVQAVYTGPLGVGEPTAPKYGARFLGLGTNNNIRSNVTNDIVIRSNENFMLEMWIWDTGANTNNNATAIAGVGSGFDTNINSPSTTQFSWAIGTTFEGKLLYKYNNNGTIVTVTSNTNLSASTWTHLAFYRYNGNTLALTRNGVEVATSSFSGQFRVPNTSSNKIFWVTNRTNDDRFVDDVHLRIVSSGVGNFNISNLNTPAQNDIFSVLYYPFDIASVGNDLQLSTSDFLGVNLSAAANLSTTSLLTSTISGSQRAAANLISSSNLTAVGVKTSEIILTAFGDSQVTVVADKIRSFEASLSASTDVSALSATVKDAIASQAAEFAQTTTAVKTVSAEAAISGITVSLTAVARIRSGDIQANVESQLTVDGDITAAGSSALASTTVVSTIGERIRYQDANLISDSELNALPLNIKQLESQQSTDVAQTVSANITAAANIAMQGITISLTALGAIRTGLISMSVEATQTTVAVKTTDVTVSANSQTTVSATGIIQVDFEADLVSASALQSSGERIRYADSQIASTAAQVSDVNYIADFQATLDSTSDISATPRGIVSITASLAAEFTQVSVPSRTRDQQLTFNSQTNIAISTNNSLTRNAESQQSSTTVFSADVQRTRPFEATLVANTIDLFVVAKIGTGLIDAAVNTVLTATANINAVGSAVLDSTTTADITAVKTTDVDSAFNSETAVVAEGTTNIIGESQMAVETLVSAQSVVTYSASVSVNSSTELAATARVIRGLALLEQSSGTLSCDVSRIREVTCDFASISIDLIFGDRIVLANANLSSQFNLSAQGREIDLTKYVYVIRNEVRTWEIPEETRIYTIRRF